MAKYYMLTKPQALWYKFYSLNWGFFSQKSALSQEKFQLCLVLEGPVLSENTFPFLHWWFPTKDLQLSTSFFTFLKKWQWPEDDLLCILSSLESLPWEPVKRLKPEKFPVCRALIRFQCRGRDPQTISASSHLIYQTFVKKHHFVVFSGEEGRSRLCKYRHVMLSCKVHEGENIWKKI